MDCSMTRPSLPVQKNQPVMTQSGKIQISLVTRQGCGVDCSTSPGVRYVQVMQLVALWKVRPTRNDSVRRVSSGRINWREWLSVLSPPLLMSTTIWPPPDTSDLCPLHLIASPQLLIADWGLKRQTLEKTQPRPSLFHQRRRSPI